jgi:hypothetical protein
MASTSPHVCATVESENWSGAFTAAVLAASDNSRAVHLGTSYGVGLISDFAFAIPAGATINGIEAKAEIASTNAAGTAYVRLSLSHDNGTNYTATQEQSVLGVTDTVKTYGGPADTWGRAWTDAEFADGTFMVKVEGKTNNAAVYVYLDHLTIEVTYTEAGAATPFTSKVIIF